MTLFTSAHSTKLKPLLVWAKAGPPQLRAPTVILSWGSPPGRLRCPEEASVVLRRGGQRLIMLTAARIQQNLFSSHILSIKLTREASLATKLPNENDQENTLKGN